MPDRVSGQPSDYTFLLWFAHARHLAAVLPRLRADQFLAEINNSSLPDAMVRGLYYQHACEVAVDDVVRSATVLPLGEPALVGGEVAQRLVFVEQDFYFRGMGSPAPDRTVTFKAAIRSAPGWTLSGEFSARHLLNDTAMSRLSGHSTTALLGYVRAVDEDARHVTLVPLMFGDPIHRAESELEWTGPVTMETHPSQVDEFTLAELPTGFRITQMKQYPEMQIKKWLAEIIGEPHVPKDWGGETSDLFSARLHVNGRPQRAAFLLKGPAHFRPMTIAALGKNGDQIDRLLSEPADIFVIQHCHHVTTAVRRMAYNYTFVHSLQHESATFMILDGTDTYRLLLARGKVS